MQMSMDMEIQESERKLTIIEQVELLFQKMDMPMRMKEIAEHLPELLPHSIRARIYENLDTKFKKLAKGVYFLIDNEQDGGVLLLEQDANDLSAIPDESVQVVIADHPYKIDAMMKGGDRNFVSSYQDTCFEYKLEHFQEKARVLEEGGFLLEFFAELSNDKTIKYFYKMLDYAEESGLQLYSIVPWTKGTFVANTGRKSKNTEIIAFFTKGKPRALRPDRQRKKKTGKEEFMSGTSRMLPTTFCFQPPSRSERTHQAEKPISLFESLLEHVTKRGEVILHQYAGSGNLEVAAVRKGLFVIAMELLSENIQKIKTKLRHHFPNPYVFHEETQ